MIKLSTEKILWIVIIILVAIIVLLFTRKGSEIKPIKTNTQIEDSLLNQNKILRDSIDYLIVVNNDKDIRETELLKYQIDSLNKQSKIYNTTIKELKKSTNEKIIRYNTYTPSELTRAYSEF